MFPITIPFVKQSNGKASAELRLTNDSDRFQFYRVKSNFSNLFRIHPSGTGIIKPKTEISTVIYLSANADLTTNNYKIMVQSMNMEPNEINKTLKPAVVWRIEDGRGTRKIYSTNMTIKLLEDKDGKRWAHRQKTEIIISNLPHEKKTKNDFSEIPAFSSWEEGNQIGMFMLTLVILFVLFKLIFSKQ